MYVTSVKIQNISKAVIIFMPVMAKKLTDKEVEDLKAKKEKQVKDQKLILKDENKTTGVRK